MQAEIIAVGSELLTPDRVDTNSLFLTQRLNHLGIAVARKTLVGDQHDHVRDAFRCALDRCDLVISSGGLGPTLDDLTREAVAELLTRKLVLNSPVLQNIEARFRRLGRTMPEVNKRQAMVPEGADLLENSRGTAPGLWLESAGRIIVLLPGPPHELKAMFTEKVEPRLERLAGATRLFYREMRTAGLTESEVEQRTAPIYTQYSDVQTTILTAPGEIQLHLRCWSADHAGAERTLNEMIERITLALGENVFTSNGQSLEEIVAHDLTLNQATVATAESCTGGLLAERLTRIPGSSSYFLGGVVCYSNDLKTAWADVPAELIETKGAVSPEVAQALAQGIRRRIGATLGIGITGIAGPSGGSPEKPVGLVYIALADANGSRDRTLRFPSDRERIRWHASQTALDMLRRYFIYARAGRPGWPAAVQT
ncbi:MAG TPA: competence/damage-inducible protein A [Candidatus Acidoferrales bacterium]|jgi:nicotinamide-nucleotide amidase|nr:competence/damage-inducible protein A [Candidatus Acidoferrales bacterium]